MLDAQAGGARAYDLLLRSALPVSRNVVRRYIAEIGLIAFLTLVDLFAAQAILPSLAARYGVGLAGMDATVNATTLGMAVAALGVALFRRRLQLRRYGALHHGTAIRRPTRLVGTRRRPPAGFAACVALPLALPGRLVPST